MLITLNVFTPNGLVSEKNTKSINRRQCLETTEYDPIGLLSVFLPPHMRIVSVQTATTYALDMNIYTTRTTTDKTRQLLNTLYH